MDDKWTPVEDRFKYGVAISNFSSDSPVVIQSALDLVVGETVSILLSIKDWYYGHKLGDNVRGIFPKSYIAIKDHVEEKICGAEMKEPSITKEVTVILREWKTKWRQLYIRRSKDFDTVRLMMIEMIELRSKIMSGTLPVDELKNLKQTITSKIDLGNVLLGFDMIVRDEFGNVLDPKECSAIELYRAHESSTEKIRHESRGLANENDNRDILLAMKGVNSLHFSLYVTVNNCTCHIGEDADILITLYDSKESKFISENYVVPWSSQGLMKEFAKSNKGRVVFCDLGSKDLRREKVYIICQIIRKGAMELKETEQGHRGKGLSQFKKDQNKRLNEGIRRPFGVAAFDVTEILKGKVESDGEKHFFIPFMQCMDKDTLDSTIRKLLSLKGEISEKDHKGQGLWISYKLLLGDLEQARGDSPHLISQYTKIARRMGFPEIILPGDVRNDLYLTLISGDFSSKASNAKNIEVTIRVCNDRGHILPEAITVGPGLSLGSEYKSVVYYHEEKPKWMETIKISLDIEDFRTSHLKITYKHRSSNESKDKNEKPFAFSFIRLMNENGTTLKDEIHELLIYKIDGKKYDETDSNVSYFKLPSTRSELESKIPKATYSNSGSSLKLAFSNISVPGLTLNPRDVCLVSSIVCSTKLTQNIDLLGLLKSPPSSNDDELKACLLAFMKVDGEDIVKFLQDILDSLFKTLTDKESDEFVDLVFKALVFVVGLISDTKYQHFRPVLNVYIEKTFSAALAYNKLIIALRRYIDKLSAGRLQCDKLNGSLSLDASIGSYHEFNDSLFVISMMKSIGFLFKFIVRSRCLFLESQRLQRFDVPLDNMVEFTSMQDLLLSFTSLMSPRSKASIEIQALCLKYLPPAIPDILIVFERKTLSHILIELITRVPYEKLKQQKLLFMSDIIQCDCLFSDPEARKILLPVFSEHIHHFLEKKTEMDYSVQVLNEILTVLSHCPLDEIEADIADLSLSLLRTVIFTVIGRGRDEGLTGNLVAIMIDILRLMTPSHYNKYMEIYTNHRQLLEFLIELLLVFKDLVCAPVYPSDWNEMLMLQNSVILTSLKQFAMKIRERFVGPHFEYQLWNNFFHCAIAFLTQKALQLENFSTTKRNKIYEKYRDMRREAASEIRCMWFHLDIHTIEFVPDLIGPFLEVALIPDQHLRKEIVPIFFEMMQCEFYSSRPSNQRSFKGCEDEMITQLDKMIESGKGDINFRELLKREIEDKFENHAHMREKGLKFVSMVDKLIRRLLEYRAMLNDDVEENQECLMICIVNLLEFYHKNKREEMYLRYLYKLVDLHIACENYTEAAYALLLHATLLHWTDEPLPSQLRSEKYPDSKTHRELKENLYKTIIDYFEKGQQWEEGLKVCKDLIIKYEKDILDYVQLSHLYQKMSTLYDHIVKQIRIKRDYYRVAYYGKGFPAFLRNKVFIHRGKPYERLGEFTKRLMDMFPNCVKLDPLAQPTQEVLESDGQYLQIKTVDPVVELKERFRGKLLHPHIITFYEGNQVQKFSLSRIFKRESYWGESEFASRWVERTIMKTQYPLPGILTCFMVTEVTSIEISPIEIAIEDMEKTKSDVIRAICSHHYRLPNLNIAEVLLMKIQGIVEAAVNGGIVNYEKAFIESREYIQIDDGIDIGRKDDLIKKLINSIASLIPVLEIAFALVKPYITPDLQPLYEHLEESFRKMKQTREVAYSKRPPPKELTFLLKEINKRNSSSTEGEEKLDRSSLTQSVGKGRSKSVFSLTNPPNIWASFPGQTMKETLRTKKGSSGSGANRKAKGESSTKWFDVNDTGSSMGDIENRSTTDISMDSLLTRSAAIRTPRPRSGGQIRSSPGRSPMNHTLSATCLNTFPIQPEPDYNESSDILQSSPEPPPLPVKQHSTIDLSIGSPDRDGSLDDRTSLSRNRKGSLPSKSSFFNKPLPPPPAVYYSHARQTSVPSYRSNSRAFGSPDDNEPPLLPKRPSHSSNSLSVPITSELRKDVV
ncbi:dedicator of cytokinesis protein 2 [Tetranychus urticae]|uniref:dedicator of cytokinesis protein 2 n=1 Tax=Tetranychus urticae TaxID=32264 RepID=UPI00077B9E96|nr:dedicator of cytokinesis protein 2 [Tetranychus urticae]